MGVLNKNWMSNAIEDVQYVKENVMIGWERKRIRTILS
jgi:hypothetical protein